VPEGHTLHRLADQLHPLVGRRLSATSPQGRFAEGARIIDGRRLGAVEAFGKHLLLDFGDDVVLHIHLGLAGSMFRSDPDTEARPGVRLRLVDEDTTVAWNLAAPTACEVWTDEERKALLSRLGPDPLRGDDPRPAFERIGRSDRTTGELLLDQAVIAGIGNVFRAEVLHCCGVHPDRPGRSLSEAELTCLWETAAALMRRAVEDGRIVTPGAPGERFVYKQDVCGRCGGPVASWPLGARTAYACPACQPV
jgi:formamidopyrimidine-DNA glycosylase